MTSLLTVCRLPPPEIGKPGLRVVTKIHLHSEEVQKIAQGDDPTQFTVIDHHQAGLIPAHPRDASIASVGAIVLFSEQGENFALPLATFRLVNLADPIEGDTTDQATLRHDRVEVVVTETYWSRTLAH
jgi:hypothetical protein